MPVMYVRVHMCMCGFCEKIRIARELKLAKPHYNLATQNIRYTGIKVEAHLRLMLAAQLLCGHCLHCCAANKCRVKWRADAQIY